MWCGVDDARLRDLIRAGMVIDKQERTLRADGSESELLWDVSFSGDITAFHELRLRADTLHVSLIQPRQPKPRAARAAQG
jgi:hypothetical protein